MWPYMATCLRCANCDILLNTSTLYGTKSPAHMGIVSQTSNPCHPSSRLSFNNLSSMPPASVLLTTLFAAPPVLAFAL